MKTSDPQARSRRVRVVSPAGDEVFAADDFHSDRLRCDHPRARDGEALGLALRQATLKFKRTRLMVMADVELASGLVRAGLRREANIPGYYRGAADCHVLGWTADEQRGREMPESAEVDRILSEPPVVDRRQLAPTRAATPEDSTRIADLLSEVFPTYPTPSGSPGYVEEQIRAGTPFRLHEDEDGRLLGCSSADLDRAALAAELTDCAVHPIARRRGLLQALLTGLIDDLRDMEYRTAFTLARATVPGVNRAFQRLGFEFRGRSPRSCRIGEGLEDMNTWSRALDPS